MASSVLETARAAHEELELLERLAVRELQREPANARDRLHQLHRFNKIVDHFVTASHTLVETYEDKDGTRKEEISTLITSLEQDCIFQRFEDKLKEVHVSHSKYHSALVSVTDDHEVLLKEENITFSDEEASGRYLDLHKLYNEFTKSKFGSLMEYSAYVGTFSQLEKIKHTLKVTMQYKVYLEHILEYLTSFLCRTDPLQDLQKMFTKLESEFEGQWTSGKVHGWENKVTEKELLLDCGVDLDQYSTVEELVELGLEKLKEALNAIGLKCGGTAQQRADRLFLLKHTSLEQLDSKHFPNRSRLRGSVSYAPSNEKNVKDDIMKQNALLEAKMRHLCVILDKVIVRTKENAERKLHLNYGVMEVEQEEVPLGWDGKPIPYWLYKLRGPGQEANAFRERIQEDKS